MSAPILPRRGFLRGLTTLPLIGGSVALLGQPTAAAAAIPDPFPGYHRELVALIATLNDRTIGDEQRNALADQWREIDRLAASTVPTSLPGVVACLKYLRREHVQFVMEGDEAQNDPGHRLMLALMDNALAGLRAIGGAA